MSAAYTRNWWQTIQDSEEALFSSERCKYTSPTSADINWEEKLPVISVIIPTSCDLRSSLSISCFSSAQDDLLHVKSVFHLRLCTTQDVIILSLFMTKPSFESRFNDQCFLKDPFAKGIANHSRISPYMLCYINSRWQRKTTEWWRKMSRREVIICLDKNNQTHRIHAL